MTKDELIEIAQVGMGIHSPNAPEYIVCEALIKALAQPEQEPVAYVEYIPCCTDQTCPKCKAAIKPELVCVCGAVWEGQELIYTPPQRKPQIWEHEGYDALCQELELWKAEAQRKPLTDEKIWEALGGIDCTRPMLIAKAIEAAHNIK